MNVKYIGLSEINGPLVALDHVSGISYDEMADSKNLIIFHSEQEAQDAGYRKAKK